MLEPHYFVKGHNRAEEVLTFLRELPDPTKAIVTTRHRIDIAYAIRLTGMPRADAQALIELEAAHKGSEGQIWVSHRCASKIDRRARQCT